MLMHSGQDGSPRGFTLAAAGLALVLSLLSACIPHGSLLEQIRSRGQLRVTMLNEPTSYYLGAHGNQGYEFRLASDFAARLNVQLVVVPARDASALRALLVSGNADIAAAQISMDDDWGRVALPSASYRSVKQLVIQRMGTTRARNVAALRGMRVVVRADSPQSRLLQELRGNGAPYLAWTELARTTAEPLDWVASTDADFTVMDETEFQFARYLNPEVVVAFELPQTRDLSWMVRRNATELRDAINAFFDDARRSGRLAQLERDARAEMHNFEMLEARRYQTDIENLLPPLRAYFEEAAAATGLDWRLIAAIGYQESHWKPQSASGSGAAGVMMLTESTAKAMGVPDRNDPRQNILGGARYFAQVMEMIPGRIPMPDRVYMAFAAYNVGYGHLEDARILTQMHGGNADSWKDVSMNLPLLAEPPYYVFAKRGYARGWEPVRYVDQVRDFLSVLEWTGTNSESPAAVIPEGALSLRHRITH
jgi:membrane-bound lytic murein transglycosylase F